MSIKMYYKDENDQFVEVSQSGVEISGALPVSTTHNGKDGDIQTVQLYLKNSSAVKWYSNIVITPIDVVDANPYGDVIYTETGWGVKLSSGATEPSSGEWEDIIWGEEINMDNIGTESLADTSTYFPFWYLITCPPNEDAKNKSDIFIKVRATENAVI